MDELDKNLVGRINEEHRLAMGAMTSALKHAIAAGELLLEARESVPFGGWMDWIDANCEFGDRTARLYCRLAKNQHKLAVEDMTIADARKLLAKPANERAKKLREQFSTVTESEQRAYLLMRRIRMDMNRIRANVSELLGLGQDLKLAEKQAIRELGEFLIQYGRSLTEEF